MKSPRERIETLLRVQGGHCFIAEETSYFFSLLEVLKLMQAEGLLRFELRTSGAVKGVDVKRKGWRPGRGPIEPEQQAH